MAVEPTAGKRRTTMKKMLTVIARQTLFSALLALLIGVAFLPWGATARPIPFAEDSPAAGASSGVSSGAGASIPAARQARNVAIITIKGPITKVTAQSVARRLQLAQRSGADAVVFDIDTPGGELGAALDICNSIKQSPISNTVAWINPNAYSAGAVIALACREIVTGDPATMGDALPIRVGPAGVQPLPEHERQKATAPLLAEVVDSARRRGHDEYLVQGIVALGVELWLVEHNTTGQRICINRDEYRAIFGSEPIGSRPRLVSAPPTGPDASGSTPPSSTSPPDGSPGSSGSAEQTPDPASKSGDGSPISAPAEAPAAPVDPSSGAVDFKAASPRLAGVSDEVSLGQERVSSRPTITPGDRGQWKLVEYVSDGNGPFTFRADDLIHYRLASAKVLDDERLKAFFGAEHLRRLDQNWSESLVVLMTNMVVRGLLIAIFLIAMILEMTHPGLILPGAIAGLALLMLVMPPLLIGMANWWEIAAIVVGVILIGVEVLILPGFGLPGVAGLILLFIGLVGTFIPQGSGLFPNSPAERSGAIGGLVTILTAFITAGFGFYFVVKNLEHLPVLGKIITARHGDFDDESTDPLDAMMPTPGMIEVGARGVAITPLRPAGKVQFGDRVADVVSALTYVPPGATVRVTSADAFQTVVELVSDPGRADAGPGGSDHPSPTVGTPRTEPA
jgi:membrane-bound serine protease (ClpP class)